MAIIYFSEEVALRDSVRSALAAVKVNRSLRILDCGGGRNPWLKDLITDVTDIDPFEAVGVIVHSGDICNPTFFQQFEDNAFDFVNCTHTLEDLRDPKIVLDQIARIGRAGFIAVPNRHQELSWHESPYWSGNSHHRWIFHIRGNGQKLEAVAKWPATVPRFPLFGRILQQLFPEQHSSVDSWETSQIIRQDSLGKNSKGFATKTLHGFVAWLRKHRAPTGFFRPFQDAQGLRTSNKELSIIWVDDISFSFLDNDYAGRSTFEMLKKTWSFLNEPIGRPLYSSVSEAIDQLTKHLAQRT